MDKNYIDKIALIDIKDKKVLLTLSKGKDAWFTPGGKRELGETDIQALTRELQEELSVSIHPETTTYFNTYEAQAYGKPPGTNVRLTCYTALFAGEVMPQSEIAEAKYFSYAEVPKTSITGLMMLDDLKEKGLLS